MRVTVCLAARSDRTKLLPFVLVNRKRPVPKIAEEFKNKLVISSNGSVWMDDKRTEDFLRKVVKGDSTFGGRRLLVWDAFAAHKSKGTMAVLRELKLDAAYIPGGCTKFIQAPDVSWNKPFKGHIRNYYTTWMTNDANKQYTVGGNPKAPALELILSWVDRAWNELSKDLIIKSFEACALSTPTDGSGDGKIACFKPEGSIGARRIDILREVRAQQKTLDGRNDFEEAGIKEGEISFEHVYEDENLLFDV